MTKKLMYWKCGIREITAQHIIATAGWDEAPKIFEALGYPTDDAFAAALWEISNRVIDAAVGVDLMRSCGYVPYCGFPLTRSGKKETLGKEERNEILRKISNLRQNPDW